MTVSASGQQGIAIVTGAGSGIGLATVRLLVGRGWHVAAVDRNRQSMVRLKEELGSRILTICGDVTDSQVRDRTMQRVAARWGGALDLLVNNAGLLWSGDFRSQSDDSIETVLSVNNLAVAHWSKAAFPLLQASVQAGRHPAVVNLSSVAALYGIPSLAIYSASKFWVRGFTEALSAEWARQGIAVRDVMPPFVETPMFEGSLKDNPFARKLGAHIAAETVARQIVAAAGGGPLHRLVSLRFRLAYLIARLVPGGLVRIGLKMIYGQGS